MTLQHNDLRDLIDNILEIDAYKSKMGSDEDVITISFSTKTKESADDLASFIEKGYAFVLDADATSSEQSDGTYKVFVEIERDKSAPSQIMELANGIENLTGLEEIKFRYYKNWQSLPLDEENLTSNVALDPSEYGIKVNESNLNNYKNFFNRSFVESIDMFDDIIRIKKAYADPVYFKFIDFGDTVTTIESINESFNANDFAEIIFLSKYIGDYNITKYGNKITLDNGNKTLVVERIIT